ncbi:MAG: hypothetical protein KF688_00565 [Pirellulales bacterium]|nr:hypothetical protein [Pirellulales bacterium]
MTDQLDRTLEFTLLAPPWALAGAALAAAAWSIASYRRESAAFGGGRCAALAALRCGAIAVLATMLAQPAWQRRRLDRPRIAVLVDRSGSMLTDDATTENASSESSRLPRWQAAAEWLDAGDNSLLAQLKRDFVVELLAFDATVAPLDAMQMHAAPMPDVGDATRLGDAIVAASTRSATVPAAIVVATDGVVTAGRSLEDAALRAQALGVPIYAVAVGSDRPRPDIAVEDLVIEPIVFPGDRLDVEAQIRATGYAGETAQVELVIDGQSQAVAEVELPSDGAAATARLAWRPVAPGTVRVAVSIAPRADESLAANNVAEGVVAVRAEPIRVLLVDSTPGFELRALKSLLERDPALALNVLLQDADPEFAEVDRAAISHFPLTRTALREYDAFVLIDVDPQLLPRHAWDELRDYVADEGAGVAIIAGPRYMPAAYRDVPAMQTLLPLTRLALNPLRLEPNDAVPRAVVPTALGARQATLEIGASPEQSAEIWRRLPGAWRRLSPVEPKPGAETLAVFASALENSAQAQAEDVDDEPAILRHYVGAGEVVMHLADESWRWRWRNDDRYFARYWGQTVRRLARGRIARGAIRISIDRREYEPGESVRVRVQGRLPGDEAPPDSVEVEIVGAATTTRRTSLARIPGTRDRYEGTIAGLPSDDYAATLAGAPGADNLKTQFSVAAPLGELSRLAIDWDALARAARTTGGRCYRIADAVTLMADLPPPEPTVLERMPPEPLWNRPWLIGLFCLFAGGEWLLRRRSGML